MGKTSEKNARQAFSFGSMMFVFVFLIPPLWGFKSVLAPDRDTCNVFYNESSNPPQVHCETNLNIAVGGDYNEQLFEFMMRAYGAVIGLGADYLLRHLGDVGDMTGDLSDIMDMWLIRGQEVLDLKQGKD